MMNSKTTPNDRQIRNSEITPPDDLLQQWVNNYFGYTANGVSLVSEKFFATQAAQWGWEQRGAANEAELQKARDEELEAVIAWMINVGYWGADAKAIPALLAARRPKLKSQAEKALESLDHLNEAAQSQMDTTEAVDIIRSALERLQEMEEKQ